MTNGQDGGRWALAGFLYQILATGWLIARSYAPAPDLDNLDDGEIDAVLLALSGEEQDLEAHHERRQDAFLTGDHRAAIVQCKYTTASNTIYRGEIEEIFERLEEAADDAMSEGHEVTACVLATNRELATESRGDESAEQYWQRKKEECRDRFDLVYVYRDLGVLEAEFHQFAREYGLFDREIEEGLDRFVGRVLRQTGAGLEATVNVDDLVETLVGYRGARPLTVSTVETLARQELEELGRLILVGQWNDRPVRRDISAHIKQSASEHALVGLYGDGGCGKSVVIWQLLTSFVGEGGCCMVKLAEDFDYSWAVNTIHKWRNLPVSLHPHDDLDAAIKRLARANDGLDRKILWLALDGLKERVGSAELAEIGEFVRDFLKEADHWREGGTTHTATLIVSARRREDIESLVTRRMPDHPEPTPLCVEIGEFSHSELLEAAELTCAELYRRLLRRAGSRRDPMGSDRNPMLLENTSQYSESSRIDETLLDALRHPTMWRAYLSDAVDREAAIDGDVAAIREIAHVFLQWFWWKLTRRQERLADLSLDTLIQILGSIAENSAILGTHCRSRWKELACATDRVNDTEADTLYREARSVGLIGEPARREWYWRHPIVYEYLTCPGERG